MLGLQRLLDLILMGNFHGHVDTFMISGAGETPQMEGSRNASK
ncbi:hypothetical protein J2Y02_003260 [Neobacillus drentensis]|nr:hypothetical protein [Neobacillus drentensis]